MLTAAHVVSGSSTVTIYFTVNDVTYSYTTSYIYVNSSYNSSTHDYDLALIYIPTTINSGITTYSLYSGSVSSLRSSTVTLVGYGYSGYGTSGEDKTSSSCARGVCRSGQNTIDSIGVFSTGSSSYVYVMDFDKPSTYGTPGGSLGNDIETTLCEGDSGGSLFYYNSTTGEYELAGVNVAVGCTSSQTIGEFDTYAYSISVSSDSSNSTVYSWITSTISSYYASVPEPSDCAILLGLVALSPLVFRRRQRTSR